MGATRVLRIVDVYGMQAIDTHHAVELVEYAVQIMDDVVAGIAHMAGVQTNAQLIGQLWALGGNALDNARQFFKATAHLGALACHGLKQYRRLLSLKHHLAQRVDNHLNADVCPLSHMRTGMKIVVVAGQRFHALQILGHGLQGKLARPLLSGAGVIGIRGMRHQRSKVVLRHKLAQSRHVIHVKVFCLATARVARKERKGIGANGQRRLPHRPIALRRRKMAPDRQHLQLPLISCGEIRSIGALFWRKQTVFHRKL